ncbi:hypothetical protein [Stenotrophomonas sp. ESTM1D_MKCIP4_1]|uniref:hypothetical protein n=1 Tax=Stenotrophomonas sp. ESTM1D_MKCIP4_1 TaxID=2072414 RepID=UPI00131EE115|nr:hypothetical protein [Stenotrophomonas sp. ESTM1D_MKCIP4_1]
MRATAAARFPAAARVCAGSERLHVSPWAWPLLHGRITMGLTLARMVRCRKSNQYANSAESRFTVKNIGRSCEEKTLPDKSVHLDRENKTEPAPHANSVPFRALFVEAEH